VTYGVGKCSICGKSLCHFKDYEFLKDKMTLSQREEAARQLHAEIRMSSSQPTSEESTHWFELIHTIAGVDADPVSKFAEKAIEFIEELLPDLLADLHIPLRRKCAEDALVSHVMETASQWPADLILTKVQSILEDWLDLIHINSGSSPRFISGPGANSTIQMELHGGKEDLRSLLHLGGHQLFWSRGYSEDQYANNGLKFMGEIFAFWIQWHMHNLDVNDKVEFDLLKHLCDIQLACVSYLVQWNESRGKPQFRSISQWTQDFIGLTHRDAVLNLGTRAVHFVLAFRTLGSLLSRPSDSSHFHWEPDMMISLADNPVQLLEDVRLARADSASKLGAYFRDIIQTTRGG